MGMVLAPLFPIPDDPAVAGVKINGRYLSRVELLQHNITTARAYAEYHRQRAADALEAALEYERLATAAAAELAQLVRLEPPRSD